MSSCIYENASDFTNGFAKVKKDGKWGYELTPKS